MVYSFQNTVHFRALINLFNKILSIIVLNEKCWFNIFHNIAFYVKDLFVYVIIYLTLNINIIFDLFLTSASKKMNVGFK